MKFLLLLFFLCLSYGQSRTRPSVISLHQFVSSCLTARLALFSYFPLSVSSSVFWVAFSLTMSLLTSSSIGCLNCCWALTLLEQFSVWRVRARSSTSHFGCREVATIKAATTEDKIPSTTTDKLYYPGNNSGSRK